MSYNIEVKPNAQKQYYKLDFKIQERLKEALRKLEAEDNPLQANNVRPLLGELKGDYRLRVGEYRVLFTPDKNKLILYVYAILPRGDAY